MVCKWLRAKEKVAGCTLRIVATSVLHGMVSDFCTAHSCPRMTAGANYEYKWADGVKYKSPTDVSAPKYMDLLFHWVQAQLDDANLFPTAPGVPFPANFRTSH